MKHRGAFGWLFFFTVIAVPGLLFYYWWSGFPGRGGSGSSAPIRPQLRPEILFSPSENPEGKLENFLASEESKPPAAAPTEPIAEPAAKEPVEEPSPETPASAAKEDPKPEELGSGLLLADLRDPTKSPYDHFLIEQRKLEAIIRKIESEPKPVVEQPIDRLIHLQGIISINGKNKAIINDHDAGVGDLVGTRTRKARVILIRSNSVLLEYKGRRFSISMP